MNGAARAQINCPSFCDFFKPRWITMTGQFNHVGHATQKRKKYGTLLSFEFWSQKNTIQHIGRGHEYIMSFCRSFDEGGVPCLRHLPGLSSSQGFRDFALSVPHLRVPRVMYIEKLYSSRRCSHCSDSLHERIYPISLLASHAVFVVIRK